MMHGKVDKGVGKRKEDSLVVVTDSGHTEITVSCNPSNLGEGVSGLLK